MVNPSNVDRRLRDSGRRQINLTATQTLTNFSDRQTFVCSGTITITLTPPTNGGIMVSFIQNGAGTTTIVTPAGGINNAGNVNVALDGDRDSVHLLSWYDGSAARWMLVANNGGTLS